jgi:hypothetical protein
MIFGDRETKKGKKGKGKDSPPTAIRGILKCIHSSVLVVLTGGRHGKSTNVI